MTRPEPSGEETSDYSSPRSTLVNDALHAIDKVRAGARRSRAEVDALRRDRELIAIADTLRGATALEPGGPSPGLFGRLGITPVYSHLEALDTLDYAEHTLWTASNAGGIEPRRRLIGEAGRLEEVPDGEYDALLASHVIEHLANPLGALAEWQRVLRPGGHLLLVVPHRDGTFDHRRVATTLEHMRRDAEIQTAEDDLTHLQEVLELHDLDRDPGAPSRAAFEQRCRDNLEIRGMHHHVFTTRSVVEVCRAAGLGVVALRPKRPFHIVCLCRTGGQGVGQLSESQLREELRHSPFLSDRAEASIRCPSR